MYRKILVALDATAADQSLLPHVAALARKLESHLLLIHVADGWAARNFDQLKLAESEEMKVDRKYLEEAAAKLRLQG
ncbi:MAG: universal stress protein, partial [Pyrinomonadaceae bacterium]